MTTDPAKRIEELRTEIQAAWDRSDYAAVTRLMPEYRALTDRPMTAAERRLARQL